MMTAKTKCTDNETRTAQLLPRQQQQQQPNTQEATLPQSRCIKNKRDLKWVFQHCTGYEWQQHFQTYTQFTDWLHRPVSGAALGVFRMLYGAAMLLDLAEERGGGQLDLRFGEHPQHCHFPLVHGLRALSYPVMGLIYLCAWLGAVGIMLGYRFRFSCLAYIIPYWYIFLLDKPSWNNHSYLFGLVGSMLLFTKANRYCSLDAYLQRNVNNNRRNSNQMMSPNVNSMVPYWNYFIIKFQFFVLYMFAGLKKFTAEWLSGYAMSSLSRHWLFMPFRTVLSMEMTDLLIVHWFTAIFDFAIAFLMTCERTRLLALPFMVSFHLMNSRLFVIGMFPWVCLAEVPLFFGFDLPERMHWRKWLGKRDDTLKPPPPKDTTSIDDNRNEHEHDVDHKENKNSQVCNVCCNRLQSVGTTTTPASTTSGTAKLRTAIVLFYCALQLFLPYSHFITQGYNNWTEGLYGYSWNMMVHSYDTILTSVQIVDNANGKVHYLHPYAFTEYDRWTKYADMAKQYAHCIHENIIAEHYRDPEHSPLTSTNISIYFDIWCSMNGRFQQRVFDPRVDLLRADWSPFKHTSWSLPLLNELNHLRPRLRTIANEVLNWNNYSDVIFVADFPGLTLDNHIAADLTNITLTILEGNVRYSSDDEDEAYFLTAGKSIALRSDVMHHVTTIGTKPSCYLYTYVNRTMLEQQLVLEQDLPPVRKPMLPLWKEFKDRVHNYRKFLTHIGNCLLYLLYNVPIPIAVRER